ncbi:MAG: hypothetical protein LBP79_00115 [Clostridiales bacterium]|jgi:hypothetical protein|nr:hypothetical protein [Clostridiales bacterium]
MYYKFSLSVLLSNLSLVFRTLLYSVCIILAASAIGAGVLIPALRPVYDAIIVEGYTDKLGSLLNGVLSGDIRLAAAVADVSEVAVGIIAVMERFGGTLMFGYIFLGCLAFLSAFFHSTFDLAAARVLNGYMSSKMRGKLLHEYVRHIPEAFGYAALKTVLSWLISAAIFVVIALFIKLTYSLLFVFSLTFAIALCIALFSLKFTLFAEWAPRIIHGGGVLKSFKISGGVCAFKKKFLTAVCLYTVLAVCVLTFTLPTFGFIQFFIFPFSVCLSRCAELVNYHIGRNGKFYADDYTVVNAEKFVTRESA